MNLLTIKEFNYLIDLYKKINNNEEIGSILLDLTGSRKSGKTRSIEEFILLCAINKLPVRTECFRFAKGDIKEMYNNFLSTLKELNFEQFFTWKENEIKCNNNLIRFDGIQSQDKSKNKIKGRAQTYAKYLIVWCEEFDEFPIIEDYIDIKMAMRNYENVIWIRTSNPRNKKHWYVQELLSKTKPIKKEMIEKGSMIFNLEDEIIHWSNWRCNKYLNDSHKNEFLQMEKTHPFIAECYSFGMPGIMEGGILTEYLHKNLTNMTPCSYFDAGLDFGFKNDAMVVEFIGYDINRNYLNVLEEYYHNQKHGFKDLNTLAREILTWLQTKANFYKVNNLITIYCDNSEASFIQMLNNEAIRRGISNLFYFKDCKKPPIEERPMRWMTLFSERRIFISQKCSNLLREMNEWEWDQNEKLNKPKAGNDHCLDALCYSISWYWHNWRGRYE